MKLLTRLAGAALLSLTMTSASAEVVLRMGHIDPPSSDKGQAMEFMANQVAELTNGEVRIEVFHSGQLGSFPEQFENVIAGSQDIQLETSDFMASADSRFGITQMPFLFRSREHFAAFIGSEIFGEIIDEVENRGVVLLGRKHITNPEFVMQWIPKADRGLVTKKPIFTPADLKGLNLRMYEAEIPIKIYQMAGANVQVISWSDVYPALATGAIDGLTGTLSDNYMNKHFEVAKYFTNTQEYFQWIAAVINKKTWDSLTPQQQEALETAFVHAGEFYADVSSTILADVTEKAKSEMGMSYIEPPIQPWIDHMSPFHLEFEKNGILPAGMVAKVQAIP